MASGTRISKVLQTDSVHQATLSSRILATFSVAKHGAGFRPWGCWRSPKGPRASVLLLSGSGLLEVPPVAFIGLLSPRAGPRV